MNRQFTPPSAPLAAIAGRRYNGAAQALHWLTALLMFAVLPLGWVMVTVTRDNPTREALFTLHKSIGMTILALTIVRLVWRGANPVPAFPARLSRWETVPAKLSHWLLYLILLVMPISGCVLSAASGHPVTFFGFFEFPSLPQNKLLAQLGVDISSADAMGRLRADCSPYSRHDMAHSAAPGRRSGSHVAGAAQRRMRRVRRVAQARPLYARRLIAGRSSSRGAEGFAPDEAESSYSARRRSCHFGFAHLVSACAG